MGTALALTVFWQVWAPDWIRTPQCKTANKLFESVANCGTRVYVCIILVRRLQIRGVTPPHLCTSHEMVVNKAKG